MFEGVQISMSYIPQKQFENELNLLSTFSESLQSVLKIEEELSSLRKKSSSKINSLSNHCAPESTKLYKAAPGNYENDNRNNEHIGNTSVLSNECFRRNNRPFLDSNSFPKNTKQLFSSQSNTNIPSVNSKYKHIKSILKARQKSNNSMDDSVTLLDVRNSNCDGSPLKEDLSVEFSHENDPDVFFMKQLQNDGFAAELESILNKSSDLLQESEHQDIENLSINFANQLNGLYSHIISQYVRDEKLLLKYFEIMQNCKEKMVLNTAKNELLRLKMKKHNALEQNSSIKKKQRALLMKLQHEYNEIKFMRNFQKKISDDRKKILFRQLKHFKTMFTFNVDRKKFDNKFYLKNFNLSSLRESRPTSPLKCYDISQKDNSDVDSSNIENLQLKKSFLNDHKKKLNDLLRLHFDLQLNEAALNSIKCKSSHSEIITALKELSEKSVTKRNTSKAIELNDKFVIHQSLVENHDDKVKDIEDENSKNSCIEYVALSNAKEINSLKPEAIDTTVREDVSKIKHLNFKNIYPSKIKNRKKKHRYKYFIKFDINDDIIKAFAFENKDMMFKFLGNEGNLISVHITNSKAENVIFNANQISIENEPVIINYNEYSAVNKNLDKICYIRSKDLNRDMFNKKIYLHKSTHLTIPTVKPSSFFKSLEDGLINYHNAILKESALNKHRLVFILSFYVKLLNIFKYSSVLEESMMNMLEKIALFQSKALKNNFRDLSTISGIDRFMCMINTIYSLVKLSTKNITLVALFNLLHIPKNIFMIQDLKNLAVLNNHLDIIDQFNSIFNNDSIIQKCTVKSLLRLKKSKKLNYHTTLTLKNKHNFVELKPINSLNEKSIEIVSRKRNNHTSRDPKELLEKNKCYNMENNVINMQDKSEEKNTAIQTLVTQLKEKQSSNIEHAGIPFDSMPFRDYAKRIKAELESKEFKIQSPGVSNKAESPPACDEKSIIMQKFLNDVSTSSSEQNTTEKSTTGQAKSIFQIEEAEELRKKQLAVEMEIKALLEQQTSQMPYFLVREIPDKPPPPYIPPSEDPKMNNGILLEHFHPNNITVNDNQIITTVKKCFDNIWLPHLSKSFSNLNDANADFKNDCLTYQRKNIQFVNSPLLFDLCNELFINEFKNMNVKHNIWEHQKSFIQNRNDICKTVENLVKQCLDHNNAVCKENIFINCAHKLQDHVDELLIKELQDEEAEWVNVEEHEVNIKNSITESILESLIINTVNELKNFTLK